MSIKTRKKRKSIRVFIFLFLLLFLSIGAAYYLYYDYNHRVNVSCIIETGSEVSASLLAQSPDIDCSFVSTGNLDADIPGTYDVVVHSGLFDYDCQILVVDTTPPTGTVENQDIMIGSSINPEDFFTYTFDASPVTASFQTTPDFNKIGEQPVQLRLEDSSYNFSSFDATLTIHEQDSEPPVFHGIESFTIYVGETISYKNRISAVDDIDGEVEFEVSGSVNNHEAGEYPIQVIASDWAGNSASADLMVTVIESEYTQKEVDALADEVLASIITDDMSDLDKVNAIYNYITSHMGYLEHSDKGDWIKAAYLGLAKHQGDCYVYACTSKELLTRAGIKNRDIQIIPTATRRHYWNLVDIGEGWHHFDTTPRNDHPRLCYLTDAELTEYSNAHYRSHNYDRDIYNDIP